jgi:hypothetical protein
MKTQKKNFHGRKSNNRWKWMAGATAAAAAGVTASQASTITINLVGNFISATDGNHLNADLTGDGHPDLTIANAFNYAYVVTQFFGTYNARVNLNGVLAYAHRRNNGNPNSGFEQLGSRATFYNHSGPYFSGTAYLTGSIPLFFKDLHINGGAPTSGLLQVTVSTSDGGFGAEIQLDSLTYNTPGQGSRLAAAVPDQGSSLALLAMGAAGILALRRWRAAQGRS